MRSLKLRTIQASILADTANPVQRWAGRRRSSTRFFAGGDQASPTSHFGFPVL